MSGLGRSSKMLIASLFFAAALAPASILLERPDFGYRDDPQTVDEEPQRFPDILSGMIVSHNGAKYLCGRSKTPDGSPGSRRYVFSLETDWQVGSRGGTTTHGRRGTRHTQRF